MSPNLLLYPVSDKRKAFTRIAYGKVVHPTTKDRIDLLDQPLHRLADILSEDLLQLCQQRRSFFNFAPTPPPVRSTSADRPATPDTAPLPFYFLPLPSPEETNQILFALVVVLLVVRVDNPTPIILDLGKAITLGILRTLEPWPSTKLLPGMGELCADAASMRTQEFGS
jgi:hypothetical protein